MDSSDVIAYQVMAGVIAAAAVFGGGRYGGRYLHEDQARKMLLGDRPDTPEAKHGLSLELAHGFKDTAAFDKAKDNLSGSEIAAGFVEPHPIEKYAPYAAGVVGILVFFLSHENARLHARKKASQAQVSRATQRFNKPGG